MEERISFINSKGSRISGVLHTPNTESDSAIILSHGFCSGKDRDRFAKASNLYSNTGYAALRFDYGGSGESYSSAISIGNQRDDLGSAIKLMIDRGYNHIGLHGESLGGLICLESYPNFKDNIETMVLWAPVSRPRDKLDYIKSHNLDSSELEEKGSYGYKNRGQEFRISRDFLDDRCGFNQGEVLSKITCPTLIIHGDNDSDVSLDDSKKALEYLKHGRLEIIPGASHSLEAFPKVFNISLDWFNNNLNK